MTSHCQPTTPSHGQWSWTCEEKHSGEKKTIVGTVIEAGLVQEGSAGDWARRCKDRSGGFLHCRKISESPKPGEAAHCIRRDSSGCCLIVTGSKKCSSLVHIFSKIRAGKEPISPQLCPLIFLKEIIPTSYNGESTCYIGKGVLVQESSYSFCTQGQGGGLFYEFSVC